MKRTTGVLTILGGVFLAAVTLQSQPFTSAQDDTRETRQAVQQAVSPDLVEQWLQVAEDVDPAKARRLREMCDRDPEEFNRVMRQSGRRIVSLAELRIDDPDLYETKLSEMRIESQVDEIAGRLVEAIRSGRQDDIAALQEELRPWVVTQVVYSIKARGDYLLRLKEHVERLERELEYEAENFQKVADRRLEEIIARAKAAAESEN